MKVQPKQQRDNALYILSLVNQKIKHAKSPKIASFGKDVENLEPCVILLTI